MAGPILVAGGAGFVGSRVSDALLAGGHEVRGARAGATVTALRHHSVYYGPRMPHDTAYALPPRTTPEMARALGADLEVGR